MAGNGQQHAAAKQEDDDARSNASSDYDQPHGFKERMEYRYRSAMRWIDRNRVLTDFIAYFSFLLVFTIVAIEANPGEDLIEQNRAVKSAVAQQEFWFNASHVRKDFYDIDAIGDFWNWLTPFANIMFANSFPEQPGFFYRYFRVLGLIRLRQVRVKKNSCRIPSQLSKYITDCYAPFSTKVLDSAPYGPRDSKTNLPVWKWFSEDELMEGTYTGRSNIDYPGSGFNITLPMDYNAVQEKLSYLQNNNWIDLQTRAVFVDFIAFNANTNLITLVKLAVEFPASSGCRPYLLLRTSRIDRLVQSEMSNTAMLAETILLVMVCLYILYEVQKVRELGWTYFHDSWVYFEIVNYLLFIGAFIMRFRPFYHVYTYGFPPRPDEFINYEPAMWAIIQWKNIMSINSVISWMRLFKYLRTVPFMQLLIGTVSLAMGQITSFMSIFVIIISGFTLANLLAFGGELAPYRSYEFTLYTLYRSLLGADYFDEMYEVNRFLGPVLFIAWTLIGFFLLLNMFVAILNDAIDEVKGTIPNVSLSQQVAILYKGVRDYFQAKYDKFVADEEDEEAKKTAKIDQLPPFHHKKAQEQKADPLAEKKKMHAEKLMDKGINEVVGQAGDGQEAFSRAPSGSAPKQKEFGQCETDEERLDLLKDRLGVIIQGMNKLKGPGIFTHAPDLKRELSSFANPYGHSSLKSSI